MIDLVPNLVPSPQLFNLHSFLELSIPKHYPGQTITSETGPSLPDSELASSVPARLLFSTTLPPATIL